LGGDGLDAADRINGLSDLYLNRHANGEFTLMFSVRSATSSTKIYRQRAFLRAAPAATSAVHSGSLCLAKFGELPTVMQLKGLTQDNLARVSGDALRMWRIVDKPTPAVPQPGHQLYLPKVFIADGHAPAAVCTGVTVQRCPVRGWGRDDQPARAVPAARDRASLGLAFPNVGPERRFNDH
jgi:hypothetical protein